MGFSMLSLYLREDGEVGKAWLSKLVSEVPDGSSTRFEVLWFVRVGVLGTCCIKSASLFGKAEVSNTVSSG